MDIRKLVNEFNNNPNTFFKFEITYYNPSQRTYVSSSNHHRRFLTYYLIFEDYYNY